MERGGHRDNDARDAGRLVWIDFDSDLTLITVDTHTVALVVALRAGSRFSFVLF